MRFIVIVTLVLSLNWVSATAINRNTSLISACLKYLTPHKKFTLREVRSFKEKHVRFVPNGENQEFEKMVTVRLYSHPFFEPLYFLEPPDLQRLNERETADALRYAEYLKEFGQSFIFVPVFKRVSVPFFDGVVFDTKTGWPLFNVSMKHAAGPYENLRTSDMIQSLSVWGHEKVPENLDGRDEWFSAVNSFDSRELKTMSDLTEVGLYNFYSFKQLAYTFGLFHKKSRPLRVIRDLSTSGMTYEMLMSADYLPELEETIREEQTNDLTFIWDRNHVLNYPLQR